MSNHACLSSICFVHLTAAPRLGRSFLTKRALPCPCSTTRELQHLPISNTCPLPGCLEPGTQRLLGHAYGAEGAPWHASAPPLPAPTQHPHVALLLSHLPLHRHSSHCGPFPDSKPLKPNFRLFSRYPWTMYSSAMPMQSSAQLLREVRPLLVLSGDHHRWCTTVHAVNSSHDAVEVTVGTFSWLQGSSKPSFGMLLFTNSTASAALSSLRPGCVAANASGWHVVVCPCWLPDNRVSLAAYAVFALASLFWLLLQRRGLYDACMSWAVTCAAAVGCHVLFL